MVWMISDGERVEFEDTGATAVQAVPHIAESAREFYVFQQTPSIIDFRGNGATDVEWWTSLTEGWQADRQMNFDIVLEGKSLDRVLVKDQWKQVCDRPDTQSMSLVTAGKVVEVFDYQQMQRIRRRIADIVVDEKIAAGLMPYYGRFCKRPCFSDDYLQAFNRLKETLIDTDGQDPTESQSTPSMSAVPIMRRTGRYDVIGRDGVTVDDKWGGGGRVASWPLHQRLSEHVRHRQPPIRHVCNIPYRMHIQAPHKVEPAWGELQKSLRGGYRHDSHLRSRTRQAWLVVPQAFRHRSDLLTRSR
ncbi:hypothetical protein [Arthrobacter sp. 2MCAF14]|uniref:hypothetical protein n=1 Tax=Arthrobacter sp. 2MCAF14 TaxID=3232982 RepID=UPI003F92F371